MQIYVYVLLGRHCCLWCNITTKVLSTPKDLRRFVEPRTLCKMDADFLQFKSVGYRMKDAKKFNNVIDECIFRIPIDHVGLHFMNKCECIQVCVHVCMRVCVCVCVCV